MKDRVIRLRVSEEEFIHISNLAEAHKVSVSRLIRGQFFFDEMPKNPETMSIKEILDVPQDKFDKLVSKKPFWSNPKK